MSRIGMTLVVLVILVLPGIVLGHEVRPGYLEIAETGEETFEVLFKVAGPGRDAPGPLRANAGALRGPYTFAYQGHGRCLHRSVVGRL